MKYRKLRIAWSVAWGAVAVLLCVLWVRSYSCIILIQHPNVFGQENQLIFATGLIRFNSHEPNPKTGPMARVFDSYHRPSTEFDIFSGTKGGFTPGRFAVRVNDLRRKDISLVFPYWLAAALFATLAAAPWVRRFSLRTLLIVTTLVAAVLGVVMWATT